MTTLIRPELSKKNKWWIPKHRYYELKHFCLQYPEWKENYESAIRYSTNGEQVNKPSIEWVDPVGNAVSVIEMYGKNISLVEHTAFTTDEFLSSYILKAVTEGLSFTTLQMVYEMPCRKDMYYDRYRKFFWILSHSK